MGSTSQGAEVRRSNRHRPRPDDETLEHPDGDQTEDGDVKERVGPGVDGSKSQRRPDKEQQHAIVQNDIESAEHGKPDLDGDRRLSVGYIPLNRLAQSLFQGCLGTKPECLPCPGRIEAASRLSLPVDERGNVL